MARIKIRFKPKGALLKFIKLPFVNYAIRMITRCAETGLVPPAIGVMVSAVELPEGFRTVNNELVAVVFTRAIPTI